MEKRVEIAGSSYNEKCLHRRVESHGEMKKTKKKKKMQ